MQALLTVEQLSEYLHKSVASIRCDATRKPYSLPPICRLPGTKRLLWRLEDVERWVVDHVDVGGQSGVVDGVTEVRPRRGRPTKVDQVAKRRGIVATMRQGASSLSGEGSK